MKRVAIVRQRRTDPAGRQLINVVCPRCDGRHWLSAGATGTCPRRTSAAAFTIANPNRVKRISA
jgi:hypothetical protein